MVSVETMHSVANAIQQNSERIILPGQVRL